VYLIYQWLEEGCGGWGYYCVCDSLMSAPWSDSYWHLASSEETITGGKCDKWQATSMQNTNRLNPRRRWLFLLSPLVRTSCLFLSLRIYFFQFTNVFIEITRGYISPTHHPIITSNTEKKTGSSSSKYTFLMKMTIVDDRKTTAGKSTYYYTQSERVTAVGALLP
jgi:hypothetical protein